MVCVVCSYGRVDLLFYSNRLPCIPVDRVRWPRISQHIQPHGVESRLQSFHARNWQALNGEAWTFCWLGG